MNEEKRVYVVEMGLIKSIDSADGNSGRAFRSYEKLDDIFDSEEKAIDYVYEETLKTIAFLEEEGISDVVDPNAIDRKKIKDTHKSMYMVKTGFTDDGRLTKSEFVYQIRIWEVK